jgi:iron(III) transport system permease protein
VVLATGLAILSPLAIILYQSFLDGPFFQGSARPSLSAFRFVFADADFYRAFGSTLIVAVGMTALAVPLGALLAFLVVRTDLPGRCFFARRWARRRGTSTRSRA